MQKEGNLSQKLPVWLAANPYKDNMRSMSKKFAAEPDALICQPPLYWNKFKKWLAQLEELPEVKPLLIAIPVFHQLKIYVFGLL
jgi:hypothetical protein